MVYITCVFPDRFRNLGTISALRRLVSTFTPRNEKATQRHLFAERRLWSAYTQTVDWPIS
jgi:hypothetical protein